MRKTAHAHRNSYGNKPGVSVHGGCAQHAMDDVPYRVVQSGTVVEVENEVVIDHMPAKCDMRRVQEPGWRENEGQQ